MTQKNSKKASKRKPAVAKAKKAKKARIPRVDRIKEELAKPATPPAPPEVVAILEKPDLKRLLSYRDRLADSKELASMLQTAYNALLSDFRTRYGLPDDALIDQETGVVRAAPSG